MKKSFRVNFLEVIKAEIVEDFLIKIGEDLKGGIRGEHEVVMAIDRVGADTPDYAVFKVTTNYYCDGDEDNIVEDHYYAVRI